MSIRTIVADVEVYGPVHVNFVETTEDGQSPVRDYELVCDACDDGDPDVLSAHLGAMEAQVEAPRHAWEKHGWRPSCAFAREGCEPAIATHRVAIAAGGRQLADHKVCDRHSRELQARGREERGHSIIVHRLRSPDQLRTLTCPSCEHGMHLDDCARPVSDGFEHHKPCGCSWPRQPGERT